MNTVVLETAKQNNATVINAYTQELLKIMNIEITAAVAREEAAMTDFEGNVNAVRYKTMLSEYADALSEFITHYQQYGDTVLSKMNKGIDTAIALQAGQSKYLRLGPWREDIIAVIENTATLKGLNNGSSNPAIKR